MACLNLSLFLLLLSKRFFIHFTFSKKNINLSLQESIEIVAVRELYNSGSQLSKILVTPRQYLDKS
jgi:hypothetical protein